MPPTKRHLLWLLPIGLAAVAGWYFTPTTEATIMKQLEEISEDLSFDGSRPSLDEIKRLFDKNFASTLTLDLGDLGESSRERSEVLEGYLTYSSGLTRLSVIPSHLLVRPSNNLERATVTGELTVSQKDAKNEQRTEPRRFVVTLEKRNRHWVVVHAKVSEPRIDQPEARP